MTRALLAAFIFFGGLLAWPSAALALCKYQAADGSWTYANTCAPLSEKAITQSANAVMKNNAADKKVDSGIDARRLRGYEYSTTTHSGTRIRMVEPNKRPPEPEFTSQ